MYKNLKAVAIIGVLFASLAQSAFASDMSGSAYGSNDLRRYQTLKTGTVEAIRPVKHEIEASNSARMTGAAIGAALLGAAGSRMNRPLGTFLLSTVGGVGGEMVANKVAHEDRVALEMVIKLDQGGYVVVVQDTDNQYPINQGDKVRLIEGQEVRVAVMR